MNEKEKAIYNAKEEWLEKVMASSMTPAQKVFAFGVYTHMYGTKLSSYPATDDLIKTTGLNRSKFSEHRQALFDSGCITGIKNRQARGRQENYTYTLNLNWDGQVPSGDTQVPCGDTQVPSGDTQVPTGCSNTPSNTPSKTPSKTTSKAKEAVLRTVPNHQLDEGPKEQDSPLNSQSTAPDLTSRDTPNPPSTQKGLEEAKKPWHELRKELAATIPGDW